VSPAYLHFLPVFLGEAETCLTNLREALDQLEMDNDLATAWHAAARAAHTLKGNAAMMELRDVSDAAFAAELLAEAGAQAPAPGTVALLLACHDTLRRFIAAVAEDAALPVHPAEAALTN
jgi:chemotaxis protein histidine kinase CheA